MAVMIGIDPHKRSHTAVALDDRDEVLMCAPRSSECELECVPTRDDPSEPGVTNTS